MRTTLLAVGLILFAVACGGSSGPVFGATDGGGGRSSDGGGCGDPPPEACSTGCNGGVTSPECVNGSWVCPPGVEIECPVDAGGSDADDGPYACGTTTCGSGQVCIHPCCGGAAPPPCVSADDAGACPAGYAKSGACGVGSSGQCGAIPCTPPPAYCAPAPGSGVCSGRDCDEECA